MTPRSLFTIILKVVGIFFFQDILRSLIQLCSYIYNWPDKSELVSYIILCFFSFLGLAICVFVVYVLLFRSNWLIDKLKLDKDFEQESFSFNIHRSTILSISIIIIGGVLIADALPLLCRQIFYWIQKREERRMVEYNLEPFDYGWMIIYSVKLLIGLILIGNQREIVNYIEMRRKK